MKTLNALTFCVCAALPNISSAQSLDDVPVSGIIVGSTLRDVPNYFKLQFNSRTVDACVMQGEIHSSAPKRVLTVSCTNNITGEINGFKCETGKCTPF